MVKWGMAESKIIFLVGNLTINLLFLFDVFFGKESTDTFTFVRGIEFKCELTKENSEIKIDLATRY